MTALLWLACCCGAMALAGRAMAADSPREVHGSADVFSAPGVALAWGVLRGATEADTQVVVRVAADRDAFAALSRRRERSVHPAGAADPARHPLAPNASTFACRARTSPTFRAPSSACSDPQIPRRTKSPRLVVFYLGVPDTDARVRVRGMRSKPTSSRASPGPATAPGAKAP